MNITKKEFKKIGYFLLLVVSITTILLSIWLPLSTLLSLPRNTKPIYNTVDIVFYGAFGIIGIIFGIIALKHTIQEWKKLTKTLKNKKLWNRLYFLLEEF